MEWVETTGKTVEAATELALEQLGVDAADAEVEVLEEPRSGLFGRTRGLGRVRARIRPKGPRPKQERRRKGGRGDGGGQGAGGRSRGDGDGGGRRGGSRGRDKDGKDGAERAASTQDAPVKGDAAASDEVSTAAGAGGRRSERKPTKDRDRPAKERTMMDDQEQLQAIEGFLTGLADAMGMEASVSGRVDEGTVRVELTGEGLGQLVGPRLATLDAVQEIARNVLQREAGDREYGKVVLDVAGVRELRREALVRFVEESAERARADGVDVVLDVMNGVDRKVVHDTVAELDGVVSVSEGEDPRRRVVIRPA